MITTNYQGIIALPCHAKIDDDGNDTPLPSTELLELVDEGSAEWWCRVGFCLFICHQTVLLQLIQDLGHHTNIMFVFIHNTRL